jgi:DNA-binding XRE family transcriptional regulator
MRALGKNTYLLDVGESLLLDSEPVSDALLESAAEFASEELLSGAASTFRVVSLEGWAKEYISIIDHDDELQGDLAALKVDSEQYLARIDQSLVDNMCENDLLGLDVGHKDEYLSSIYVNAVIENPEENWKSLAPEEFSACVQHLQKAARKTKEDIANELGISRQYLSLICRGYKTTPHGDEPVDVSINLIKAMLHTLIVYKNKLN